MSTLRRSARIPVSFAAVSRILEAEPGEVLPGEEGAVWLEVVAAGIDLARPLRVVVGEPRRVQRPRPSVALGFSLEARRRVEWRPLLEADVQAWPDGPGLVELVVEGRPHGVADPADMTADLLQAALARALDRLFSRVVDRLHARGRAVDALIGVPG